MDTTILDDLKFDANGLIPAIVQDERGAVIMLAYMNNEAVRKTIETGRMHYYSRSRNKLWLKGESSGHFQQVKAVYADCDTDCLLFTVQQTGAACHDGYYSCFYRQLKDNRFNIVAEKVFDPEKVYKK